MSSNTKFERASTIAIIVAMAVLMIGDIVILAQHRGTVWTGIRLVGELAVGLFWISNLRKITRPKSCGHTPH